MGHASGPRSITGPGKHELQPQPARLYLPSRFDRSRSSAGPDDIADAASPCLDHAGAEERIGDPRIARRRSVRSHELVERPVGRQRPRIPQRNTVVVHPDLNRRRVAVIPVRDRVEHCFTYRLTGRRWGFTPVNAVVGNFSPRVLRAQQVYRAVHLDEQVAFDDVLVREIGLRSEVADLHEGAGEEARRVGMKQQDCRATQILALAQMQHLDQIAIGLTQRLRRQSVAGNATPTKLGQRSTVQLPQPNIRHRRIVPVAAMLTQQEPVQRGTPQDLLGTAAAIVVFAFVADRIGRDRP